MSKSETLTAPDGGLAQMRIEGRLVTFDTTRFRPGPNEDVVRVHLDGRITVGCVRCEGSWQRLGPRCFSDPWTATGSGHLESSPVIVLGLVIR